jgi:hypothetical protein
MSGRISYIALFLLALAAFSSCQKLIMPAGYLPKASMAGTKITGSWALVKYNWNEAVTADSLLEGELLAIQEDTVFLLTTSAVKAMPVKSIRLIWVYNFKRPVTFGTSFLFFIPNLLGTLIHMDYFPAFLQIGVPFAVTSMSLLLVDYNTGNSVMRYPRKYTLKELSAFSRYPAGLPPGIDRTKLRLVEYDSFGQPR